MAKKLEKCEARARSLAHLSVSKTPVDELAHFHRFLARAAAWSNGGGGHHVPVQLTPGREGSLRLVCAMTNIA